MASNSCDSEEGVSAIIGEIRNSVIAREVWPEGGKALTFPELLRRYDPEGLREFERSAGLAEAFLTVPLVAVAGLNDQGKSSLVASFLSESGRARVLRGTRRREGTFRFTLWLPSRWRDDAPLRQALEREFAHVFGRALEPLPDSPQEAWVAQNADRDLDVPLLAWDSKLDELGIGLLDCPDIQKLPDDADHEAPNRRLALLKAAGQLCAATIVVAKHENATVRDFHAVSEAMVGRLHIYAFNQMRELAPHDVLKEVAQALHLPEGTACYGAYDYGLRSYERRTPGWDHNRAVLPDESRCLPCFFRLVGEPADNAPENIAEERSLSRLATAFDWTALVRDLHSEKRHSLRTLVLTQLDALDGRFRDQQARLDQASAQVWEACLETLRGDDGQRIIFDAEMASDFAQAIVDEAPWYIRAPLRAKAAVSRGVGKATEFAGRFTPEKLKQITRTIAFGNKVKEAAEAFTNMFRKSAQHVPPESREEVFARLLVTRWRKSGHAVEASQLHEPVALIFQRFGREGLSNPSKERWGEIARKFWKQAPKGKAAFAVAVSFLTALGVVLYTAIEPVGGTVLFAFMFGKAMVALTVKELLVALGLGAAVQAATSIVMQQSLEAELGPLQRRRFFAISCDEFGLPRWPPPPEPRTWDIPAQVNRDGICISGFGLRKDEFDEEARARLRRRVEGL